MTNVIITAKESVNKYGFVSLLYKEGRKVIAYINHPNEFTKGFRAGVNLNRYGGFCWGLHNTIETPKRTVEEYLINVYSGYNKSIVINYK